MSITYTSTLMLPGETVTEEVTLRLDPGMQLDVPDFSARMLAVLRTATHYAREDENPFDS